MFIKVTLSLVALTTNTQLFTFNLIWFLFMSLHFSFYCCLLVTERASSLEKVLLQQYIKLISRTRTILS